MAGTIIIAYGANLTAPGVTTSQAFAAVVKALAENGVRVARASRLWRSQAWPNPDDPPYVNAVMIVETALPAAALLETLHRIEHDFGRRRGTGARNAPRTLDLDLIAYGGEMRGTTPVLPHPRAHERGFVMGPLSEIAPDWTHPALGRTAAELYAAVTVGRDAQPV